MGTTITIALVIAASVASTYVVLVLRRRETSKAATPAQWAMLMALYLVIYGAIALALR